jgi:hypothetical protein
MTTIPIFTSLLFVLTTLITVYLFYRASGKKNSVLILLLVVMVIEAAIGLTGFFTVTDVMPPRLLILLVAPMLFIVFLFSTENGRRFIDGFDMKQLTALQAIRILVEIILFQLFIYKAMPVLMTFEGRNMDIISGLTTPLVYYFVWVKKTWNRSILLVWNIVCLVILTFTVSVAILSAPTPFQQFGFNQPTVAILYFPFVWLPGIIVPIVYFSHLISIRRLLRETTKRQLAIN